MGAVCVVLLIVPFGVKGDIFLILYCPCFPFDISFYQMLFFGGVLSDISGGGRGGSFLLGVMRYSCPVR